MWKWYENGALIVLNVCFAYGKRTIVYRISGRLNPNKMLNYTFIDFEAIFEHFQLQCRFKIEPNQRKTNFQQLLDTMNECQYTIYVVPSVWRKHIPKNVIRFRIDNIEQCNSITNQFECMHTLILSSRRYYAIQKNIVQCLCVCVLHANYACNSTCIVYSKFMCITLEMINVQICW